MNCLLIHLELQSALGTPLAADTLFGHICWGMYYNRGEKVLQQFLAEMAGKDPPLVISDPFPKGFLPAPVLPALTGDEKNELLQFITDMNWADLRRIPGFAGPDHAAGTPSRIEAHDVLKILSRRRWLPIDLIRETLSEISLARLIDMQLRLTVNVPPEPVAALSPHNRINRLSGGTVEGGLFFSEDTFIPDEARQYELYCLTSKYNEDELGQVLEEALAGGYGRDKSIGRGVIKVLSIEPCQLPGCTEPNAVLLLGPCVPAPSDPHEGYWELSSKSGKLGGHWAVGPGPDGTHNPHKNPVVMLRSGTVLLTDSPEPFYGRMVEGIHPSIPEVVHYGLAPDLPLRIIKPEDMS